MSTDFLSDIKKQTEEAVITTLVKEKHEHPPSGYRIRFFRDKDKKVKEVKTKKEVLEELELFLDMDFIISVELTKLDQKEADAYLSQHSQVKVKP